MEVTKKHEDEEMQLPVSPTAEYFNSSVLSISIIGVLETENPLEIDESTTLRLINDLFLPINPRFSCIMIQDKKGAKKWKKVEVKPENHIHNPVFPEEKSIEFYDECFNDYVTKISSKPFPQNQPLWEIHIIKYSTKSAAGNIVFRLHHSLGDGFSLMGALLSCLQRADNPLLPKTFPKFRMAPKDKLNVNNNGELFGRLSSIVCGIGYTVADFAWSFMKSTYFEDDKSPIRSGEDGVEFQPVTITNIAFSIDRIKEIKACLGVSINDVICGVIFLGTRLYMKSKDQDSAANSNSTALVLLNTRNIGVYKSVKEMVEPKLDSKWGNQFGFLHVDVPKLGKDDDDDDDDDSSNPLGFILKAQQIIKRKRSSAAVFLTGKLLDSMRGHRGPEATAKYIHGTLNNSSLTISNMVGPVERLALANNPIKGMYFMVTGVPQSLTISIVSYTGVLRVAIGTEKGKIDPLEFNSCILEAFDVVFKAAHQSATTKS